MPVFLVTGNPGSGKSALALELAGRGVLAIDPDNDPQLSYWEDAAGNPVSGPRRPDQEWLAAHRWVWRRRWLGGVLARHERAVFGWGIARKEDRSLGLFG